MLSRLQLWGATSTLLALTACGQQADSGKSNALSSDATAAASSAPDNDSVLESIYEDATWVFQCPNTAPLPVPPGDPNSLVMVDAGPYNFPRQRLVDVPFKIKGKLCPTERLNRDAIFVVDVSGSMGSGSGNTGNDPQVPTDPNDPQSPKTCGRLQALNAIIDRLPVNVTNFAIVTFDATVQRSSAQFYSNKTALVNNITAGDPTKLPDVICQVAGGTTYRPALQRASDLFRASRQYATKEIYFLSDGAPTDGSQAEQLAAQMKTTGIPINGQNKQVTIATVMLGTASDAVMKRVASLDVNNQPIHAVATNAGDLARILDGLADNQLAGSALQHGGVATNPQTIDIMPFLDRNTLEFELPTMPLNIGLAERAYDVKFEYWDTHRNRFTIVGKLNWQDGP